MVLGVSKFVSVWNMDERLRQIVSCSKLIVSQWKQYNYPFNTKLSFCFYMENRIDAQR